MWHFGVGGLFSWIVIFEFLLLGILENENLFFVSKNFVTAERLMVSVATEGIILKMCKKCHRLLQEPTTKMYRCWWHQHRTVTSFLYPVFFSIKISIFTFENLMFYQNLKIWEGIHYKNESSMNVLQLKILKIITFWKLNFQRSNYFVLDQVLVPHVINHIFYFSGNNFMILLKKLFLIRKT